MRCAPYRTLAAVAAVVGLVPTLSALTVEDRDLKLSLILNLQTRAEVSSADDRNGRNYDIESNGQNSKPDTADFYIRRFRPGFKGTYQDAWQFAAVMNADNADRNYATAPNGTGTTGSNRALVIHQAYIGRTFGGAGVDQYVQGGLDYAFFNMANASNSAALLPNQRASQALLPVRGTGVGYRLSAGMVRFGADVQNNTGDSAAPDGDTSEGLCYTTRLELTGPGSLALKKWQETYLNQEGAGYIVGVEAGYNQNDRLPNGAVGDRDSTTFAYGVDAVFHWEGLNVLGEARYARVNNHATTAAGTGNADVHERVLDAQAGYAFPVASVVFEPAIRYSRIDLNRSASEVAEFSAPYFNDFGASGDQWDAGINCYFNGHGNKLQLAYTRWKAESGQADANIVRLQHQLNF